MVNGICCLKLRAWVGLKFAILHSNKLNNFGVDMRIPGELVALITFPGVIAHELSHLLMCKILKVNVLHFRLFIPGGKVSGYVLHEKTDSIFKSILISYAPLIFSSILCLFLSIFYNSESKDFLNGFIFWLAISVGMNSLPSNTDINNVQLNLTQKGYGDINLYTPIRGFMLAVDSLRVIWVDLFYAVILITIGGYFNTYLFHT